MKLKYALLALVILYSLSWMPWMIIKFQANRINDVTGIPRAEIAIIFGGLHKEGAELSETNRERLLAGKVLLEKNIVDRLVVSNTPLAVHVMKDFLYQQGVSKDKIEEDTTAAVTEDSCISERNSHPENRSVIFISHGYHLPRVIFVCKKAGVDGIGVPAEMLGRTERKQLPYYEVFLTRFTRYHREAGLTWLTLLGLYHPTVLKKF